MTAFEEWAEGARLNGVHTGQVTGMHPDYIHVGDYDNYNSPYTNAWVRTEDEAKAIYHNMFGKPVDIDSVWEAREKYYQKLGEE